LFIQQWLHKELSSYTDNHYTACFQFLQAYF